MLDDGLGVFLWYSYLLCYSNWKLPNDKDSGGNISGHKVKRNATADRRMMVLLFWINCLSIDGGALHFTLRRADRSQRLETVCIKFCSGNIPDIAGGLGRQKVHPSNSIIGVEMMYWIWGRACRCIISIQSEKHYTYCGIVCQQEPPTNPPCLDVALSPIPTIDSRRSQQ